MRVSQFKNEMITTSNIFSRAGKPISVVFEGDGAKTDGDTIYLPALDDNQVLTHDQIAVMRGFVDQEAGHNRHSDMPFIMDKYTKWVDNSRTGLKNLHNSIEDIWMERKVMDEYPGAWKNLSTTRNTSLDKSVKGIDSKEEYKEIAKGFNVDSVHLALHSTREEFNGHEEIQERLDPKLLDHAKEWHKHIDECETSQDAERIAKAIYKLIETDPNLESNPEDFDPDSGEGVPDEGGGGDQGGQEPMGGQQSMSDLRKEIGDSRSEEAMSELELAGDIEEGGDCKEGDGLIPAIGKPQGDHVSDNYRVYSTREDIYYDPDNPGYMQNKQGFDEYHKTIGNLSGSLNTMKARLKRALLAKERRDWDTGKEMGRLDSKRLVSAYQGNPNVFKKRADREEINTSVLILVDQSGSMCGSKINTAQECAIALSKCLEGTGVEFQVSGFTTAGVVSEANRSSGPFHRIERQVISTFKRFKDPVRKCETFLGSMKLTNLRNNADRCAVSWAVEQLRKRETNKKVLVVFSDGHPACQTVNVDYKELTRHTRLVVEQATKDGIHCVGVGIKDNAVTEIYEDNIVVDSLGEFTGATFNKFAGFLLK